MDCAPDPTNLPRPGLVADILSRPEPIVVLQAPAGLGKSNLLTQISVRLGSKVHKLAHVPEAGPDDFPVLWDIAPGSAPEALPECYMRSGAKLIIAKRSDCDVPGLARAIAYRKACVLEADDLVFGEEELLNHFPPHRASRLHDQTAGWPFLVALVAAGRLNTSLLSDVFELELLQSMPTRELIALSDLLAGRQTAFDIVGSCAPFVKKGNEGTSASVLECARLPLEEACSRVLARRYRDPAQIDAVIDALLENGKITDAITMLQTAGNYDRALELLADAKGMFFIYRYGPADFDRVLAGFPSGFVFQHETLVICLAMQALKHGDVARARHVLSDYLGPAANEQATVLADTVTYSLPFRFFRLLMLIYEDLFITDDLFDQIFEILGELPAEAHLERGCFYNSLLEFYIRRRRFAEAEDVAVRAREHYQAAGVPMLQFYISLDQSVMRLMSGDANEARKYAVEAAANLASVRFDSPNDVRLLALLNACIDYEGGKVAPLAQFLSSELDGFSHGEIWPTLIDFALHYGSQALSQHFSTIAARSFLDRWRVYQSHNQQFQTMIGIREAIILQNGNRWQEAAERLSALPVKVSRDSLATGRDDLSRLQERDEIALALVWLRHMVFEAPRQPWLEERINAMLNNLYLTGRQKISLEIWLAYVNKHQRNLTKGRVLLQKTFELAAFLGTLAPLTEERFFLADMMGNQRIVEFLRTSGPARQVMRRLADAGVASSALGARSGLSRRETKVLLMITEGGSNKFIAHALDLSEATVKFHLGNVYRKLGCKKRREAISAARALGLVS